MSDFETNCLTLKQIVCKTRLAWDRLEPHEGGARKGPSNVATVVHGHLAGVWVGVGELTGWEWSGEHK